MRRVVVRRPGGWDRLELEETPSAPGADGDVRVAVSACGVNFADVAVRLGLYASAKEYVGWPITPGFDFAGTVVEGGGGWAPGDRVFGVTRFGGYASEVIVPPGQLLATPDGWSDERAAAFPTVHLTAWYALHELGAARPGQTALVHSAAGGVGTALLHLCRHAGVQAVGVVRGEHKVASVEAAGAIAIDKGAGSLWPAVDAAADGFDLVFDANGIETVAGGLARLKPRGRLVVYGSATMLKRGSGRISWPSLAWRWLRRPRIDPMELTTDNRSVLGFNLSFLFAEAELLQRAMATLLGLDLPEPPIQTYPLDRVADAHRDLESGTTVGKLVLLP